MGETTTHASLKRLGAALLFEDGCRAVAAEVRCPIARYRVDVAGYLDPIPAKATARTWTPTRPARLMAAAEGQARTVFLECKQSRADYLRDSRQLPRLLTQREMLERERRRLEDERIKTEEPHLRRSTGFLFSELESWDFAMSANKVYREVVRRLDQLDGRIHGQTKFARIARYRLADVLYVLAPKGLLHPREIAPGWGLIECPADLLDERSWPPEALESVRIGRPAPLLSARRQDRVLRNIAVAASRDAFGVTVRRAEGCGAAGGRGGPPDGNREAGPGRLTRALDAGA